MNSPVIEIRDLTRTVPGMDRPLVDVAHLEIQWNDRLGLVGPTGSGKSSLLRMIAMLDPCKGCVLRFHGAEITCDSILAYRRKVVYLPQRPALIASTVRDNLMLPFQFAIAECDFQETKVVALLERLGKPREFLHRPAEALSGGERQFVSLVRAIQLDPQVLLLDEPTASLDAASTDRIEDVLMHWHNESSAEDLCRAFVLVSHDTEQVRRMTGRVIEIHDGSVRERLSDV